MFLECVTVCEFYGDYLEQTLPCNRDHFDHYVVVTSEADTETIGICRTFGVKCVLTNGLRDHAGDQFNKGRAINDGLRALHRTDWILHLDADMVLPADFRLRLEQQVLDPAVIYGTPRYQCPSFAKWKEHCAQPDVAPPFSIGNTKPHQLAVGYFQLFHARAVAMQQEPWYPEQFGHAGRSDRFFYRKWPRRAFLERVIPIHLHEATNEGINWRGRITPRFAASVPDGDG